MTRRSSSSNDDAVPPEEIARRTRSKGKSAAQGVQGRATGDGNSRANRILKQAEENATRIEEEGTN